MEKPTRRRVLVLRLNPAEHLRLSMFVASNQDWVARHAVPLETVVRLSLQSQRIELLRLQKIEPHPVYELTVRLGQGSPVAKRAVEMAVRQAFAAAGQSVRREFAYAVIWGDRAKVTVHVDSLLPRGNRLSSLRPKPFPVGRR